MKCEPTPLYKAYCLLACVVIDGLLAYSIFTHASGFEEIFNLIAMGILVVFMCSLHAFDFIQIDQSEIIWRRYFRRNAFELGDLYSIDFGWDLFGSDLVKSLRLFFIHNGKKTSIPLYDVLYSKQALAQIAGYLLQLKPSVEVDQKTHKLMESYSTSAAA